MATRIRSQRTRRSQRKTSKGFRLQKANGNVAPRVRAVGADKFGIVCIDPAKHRSDWIMADFTGNVLIDPQPLPHRRGDFRAAIELVRQAVRQHDLGDLIVIVERTGDYHLPVKRAFADGGFEVRIVHPFVVKQHRQAADPGNKTDLTDLAAMHRAAVAGLGLLEAPLDPPYRQLQILIRHRRDLVKKSTALSCQIREHLDRTLPGYAACFADPWDSAVALPIARLATSPAAIIELGFDQLSRELRRQNIRFQRRSLEKILAWAEQAPAADPDAALYHRVAFELIEDRQQKRLQIRDLERDIARWLAQTPFVLLLAIPGLNVVSIGDLAGEMGPIAHYANQNAITGRAGIFPSRSQSNQTDYADGPIIRCANRRLRAALMRIADNLVICNAFFRGQAELQRSIGRKEQDIRVRAVKRFSRIAYNILVHRQIQPHKCCRHPDAILTKLIEFAHEHLMPPQELNTLLMAAADQLPRRTHAREADALNQQLEQAVRRRTGPTPLAEILPAIVARLTQQPDAERTHMVVPD